MTFREKYEYLFTDLQAFGKFYPAQFKQDTTIEQLRQYAKGNLNSTLPIIRGQAINILADIQFINTINDQL